MSEWPVEHDGHAYRPLPASWLDHPAARDSGADGPRCLAVSCEIHGGRILRVRYAHPVSGNVIETFGTAKSIPNGDGYGPVGLVDGSGWPRSFVPSPGESVDAIRSSERDHLQELWSERLGALDWDYERETLDEDPEQRLIADGGRARSGTDQLPQNPSRDNYAYECDTVEQDSLPEHLDGCTCEHHTGVCQICGYKITIGSSGVEYGHARATNRGANDDGVRRDCIHRPLSCNSGEPHAWDGYDDEVATDGGCSVNLAIDQEDGHDVA